MEFTVSSEHAGQRLDVYLAEHWDEIESRSGVQRSIKAGRISIDGKLISRTSLKILSGQKISITANLEPASETLLGNDIPLNVVYEDDDIAVIDKPVGMTVHPGAGHVSDTMANAAVARWPRIASIGEPDRPGIVHRLDRDTSGLLVVALSDRAYARLTEMIRNHEIDRIYTALVHGVPESAEGVVDAPIGRDPHHRTRQTLDENGRPSRTHYRVDYELGDYSYLEIRLETGRMHQIRVHMKAIGNPVVGDKTYGVKKNIRNLNRQFLHASKLEFAHPISGEQLSISSDLPADLKRALATVVEG